MRTLLTLGVALLLSGCMNVGSFGTYWDKGYKDSALLGTWKTAGSSEVSDPNGAPDTGTVSDANGFYLVAVYRKSDNQPTYSEAKTLDIGAGKYLMLTSPNSLIRYEVNGKTIQTYKLDREKLYALADQQQINLGGIGISGSEGGNTSIREVNEAVYNLFVKISDTDKYWHKNMKLNKIK